MLYTAGVVIIFFLAALFWEFVAWAMHRYVMHGFGWYLHRDHHVTHGRRFQRNDLFVFFFALCSFLLIFFGFRASLPPLWSAGFGVALYGLGYAAFHDVMFHKRFKRIHLKSKHPYLLRITNAHRTHHRTTTKEGATSFSFLWAPRKYNQPTPSRGGTDSL
jgi:beta-carotene 3-hydroxylase